mmetsp:Transcript_19845/g.38556  ORF Transcript_19845/g.38556 Transcript_19845/m.38556 type:complete len:275 (+) Transcript_19845:75-899(+)|eukprot:4822579-Pleurochrysis_carterae.AAC.3
MAKNNHKQDPGRTTLPPLGVKHFPKSATNGKHTPRLAHVQCRNNAASLVSALGKEGQVDLHSGSQTPGAERATCQPPPFALPPLSQPFQTDPTGATTLDAEVTAPFKGGRAPSSFRERRRSRLGSLPAIPKGGRPLSHPEGTELEHFSRLSERANSHQSQRVAHVSNVGSADTATGHDSLLPGASTSSRCIDEGHDYFVHASASMATCAAEQCTIVDDIIEAGQQAASRTDDLSVLAVEFWQGISAAFRDPSLTSTRRKSVSELVSLRRTLPTT